MNILPSYNALTASAKIILPSKTLTPQYDSWQSQLWDYYDRLGEFEAGVSWRANTMSRIRLLAAELQPGGEEPTPLESGPAVEAVERLAGGTGGQSQLMKEMTIHLSVPGEGWLVGEMDDGAERWFVASADELRIGGKKSFELREDEDNRSWRQLAPESVVVRFWNPHPRFGWRATSDAKHAKDAMLELDLINKRIIAEIISRLASNGILLYDKQKLSFPGGQQPKSTDSVDPFAQILVDVASRGIKDPTSPEATIPIPIGFDMADLTDVDPKSLLQHVKMADFLDDKLFLERESAVKRLATSLDMPSEVLLGIAGMNHWGAWQVEESGLKIHIMPFAELVSHSLTTGYLIPTLKANGADTVGPNGGKIVIWYDPSEITVRPDRSSGTVLAYDRGEVPGRVLRREIGLSEEGDAPTSEEYRDWLMRLLGRTPATAAGVLEALGGPTVIAPTAEPEPAPETDVPDAPDNDIREEEPVSEPPDTLDNPNPRDSQLAAALNAISQLPNDDLNAVVESIVGRLDEMHGPVSTWVEADVPSDDRVTPVRRSDD